MPAIARSLAFLPLLLLALSLPAPAFAGSYTYAFSGVFTSVENTAPGQPLPPAWLDEGHDIVGQSFSGTFTVDLDGPNYDNVYGNAHRSSYLDPDIYLALSTHTIARPYEHGSSWVHVVNDMPTGDAFSIYLFEAFVSKRESTLVQLSVRDPLGQMLSKHRLPSPIAWREGLQTELRVVVGSGESDSVVRGELRQLTLVSSVPGPTAVPSPTAGAIAGVGGLLAMCVRRRAR